MEELEGFKGLVGEVVRRMGGHEEFMKLPKAGFEIRSSAECVLQDKGPIGRNSIL